MPPNGSSGMDKPFMIDGQHAGLQPLADRMRRSDRTGEGIGGEPERQAIGFADRIVEGGEAVDDGDRPEWLLVHNPRMHRHVGDHGRLEEITFVADPPAAGAQRRALRYRVIDQRLQRRDPPLVGQRSHLHVGYRDRFRP